MSLVFLTCCKIYYPHCVCPCIRARDILVNWPTSGSIISPWHRILNPKHFACNMHMRKYSYIVKNVVSEKHPGSPRCLQPTDCMRPSRTLQIHFEVSHLNKCFSLCGPRAYSEWLCLSHLVIQTVRNYIMTCNVFYDLEQKPQPTSTPRAYAKAA